MGGADTEITEATVDVLVEAAHFDPVSIARSARRHKLPSEASKRFERGVDPELPPVAAQRVATCSSNTAEAAQGRPPTCRTSGPSRRSTSPPPRWPG